MSLEAYFVRLSRAAGPGRRCHVARRERVGDDDVRDHRTAREEREDVAALPACYRRVNGKP